MRFVLTAALTLLCGAALAQQAADAIQPEAGTSGAALATSPAIAAAQAAKEAGKPVVAQNYMVAAANPLAVQAGVDVLAEGGTAADALVAVQTVLGLVEPQSSGLGGGAFLVWYDAESETLTTLDGRETAPLAATPDLFLKDDGTPMGFFDAVVGGRSVGTPGTPALLAELHARWGTQPWAGLFDAAIDLATDGFEVSPRLAQMIAQDAERLATYPVTADYFMPDGAPLQAGALRDNPDYAATLRSLAVGGAEAFYTGQIAADIEDTVQRQTDNPGVLSQVDLSIYRVKERPAICAPYRDHEVCGMGPPSSGALAVGQIFGMLEGYDLAALGPANPESWRLIGDASRLAFADRGRFVADSDFVPLPVKGMLDPAYLVERGALLSGDAALEDVTAGTPAFDHSLNLADDQSIELPSTSHVSIVDSYGNVASMTTTIENAFGSRLMVHGFLLNNELTDFSFATHQDGVPIANAIAPAKRPRSSMAPTIVMKDGAPVLAIGSPGGSRIIGYVAKSIIAHLDWGMDVQQAVALPHAVNRFGSFDLEDGTSAAEMERALMDFGYEVGIRDLNSGLHAIAIAEQLHGGADPRREGIAMGD